MTYLLVVLGIMILPISLYPLQIVKRQRIDNVACKFTIVFQIIHKVFCKFHKIVVFSCETKRNTLEIVILQFFPLQNYYYTAIQGFFVFLRLKLSQQFLLKCRISEI